MENNDRQIVIPGETICTGGSYLPGDGTYRDKEDVVSRRYGFVNISENYVKVVALSGSYYPRRGNTIIGTVVDIMMSGWLIDFGGPVKAFLPLMEVPRFVNKNELRDFLDFGDSVVLKVSDVKGRGLDVSIKQRGLGKIDRGMLINVNPNKVPRIIGKEGSMVRLIRGATGCNLTVGQNGIVWISGESIEKEIQTRKIIDYIVENSTVQGLTEKVEEYIKELGLEIKLNESELNKVEELEVESTKETEE